MSGFKTSDRVTGRSTTVFLVCVIGVAAVGYCVGVSDGVPKSDSQLSINSIPAEQGGERSADARPVSVNGVEIPSIEATNYADMRRSEEGPTSHWKMGLDQIPQPAYDLLTPPKPTPEEKLQSTRIRATRRAFNGAPPIIPHAVERTSDGACYACHGKGMKIGDQVAGQMSHGFLANCTQCHAPPPPTPFADVDASVASNYVGLPAPTQGKRAFPGAPPTIPHSTLMRESCLVCHGGKTAWSGFESTHPWRSSCTQCHAPSAALEQAPSPAEVDMLPGLRVIDR